MLHIPELLGQLAPHLDAVDLARCVQVSQAWSQIFTPYLWATFDDSIRPWASMANSYWQPNLTGIARLSKTKDERKARLALFVRNCHHIRHLTIHHAWTLELCISARLTGLVDLHVMLETGIDQLKHRNACLSEKSDLLHSPAVANNGDSTTSTPQSPSLAVNNNDPPASQQEEYADQHDLEKEDTLAQQALVPRSQLSNDKTFALEPVPSQLFYTAHGFGFTEQSAHMARVELTEKCWQLVYNNRRSLSQLVFGIAAKKGLCRPQTTTDFWSQLLSRLTCLERLEMTIPSPTELLLLLPTWEHRTLRYYSSESLDIQTLSAPGYADPGLRSIMISMPVRIRELKAMLGFWPNLEHLSLHHDLCDDRAILQSQLASVEFKSFENTYVQEKLTTLRLESPAALLRSNIHFPGLRSLTCRKIASPEVFRRRILTRFPLLESVTFSELEGATPAFDPVLLTDAEKGTFPLKYLTIRWSLPLGSLLSRIVDQCPHLVEVKVPYGCPKLLSVLGNCTSLQRVSLTASGECSKVAVNILVNCRWLTELVCQDLRIYAEDILSGGLWSCVGLRKLRCEIVGIPRLDMTKAITTFRAGMFKPIAQQSTVLEEPLLHELIEDQMALVAHSRTVQRMVYGQLARLTRLKELHLGFMGASTRTHSSQLVDLQGRACAFVDVPVPDTLEFSLESGLDQLASLRELRSITVKGNYHMIETLELDWMVEHWPMLRLISGVDRFGHQLGTPGHHVRGLKEHMRKIQPKVEIRA
ncbi:hypothetical protein BG003_007186 [Podila horticola]|nr:hypothetical protein BG003_007186 [Podila horticola]